MTTLEAPAPIESQSQVLLRLEATVIWMWSTEPICEATERRDLLARHWEISRRVERLALRREFEPGHEIDGDELRSCVTELDDLSRRWLDVGEPERTPG